MTSPPDARGEEARLADLQWLEGPEGAGVMEEVRDALDDPFALARLAAGAPDRSRRVSAAAEQWRLRHRAESKFRNAGRLWLTEELLEQSSGDVVAGHTSSRYKGLGAIADLCCGLGGQTRSLAGIGRVAAVDQSPLALWLTSRNIPEERRPDVTLLCGRVPQALPAADAAWLDPARRRGGRRAGRGLAALSPGPGEVMDVVSRYGAVGVKLGPSTPEAELDAWLEGTAHSREWISLDRSCRELVIWFGALAEEPGMRLATLLPSGRQLRGSPAPWPAGAPPGRFLLEPDAAIIGSGLVGNLCHLSGYAPLDPQVAYVTGDADEVSEWGLLYRLLGAAPFRRKRLAEVLRSHGAGSLVVKTRGSAVDPPALQAALRGVLKQGDPRRELVCFATRIGERAMMLWGERVESGR